MRISLRLLSFLLLPFAWVYGLVVRIRNFLYDHSYFSSYQSPIPVICVGNLSVGGTGKTPQVEYLAQLLKGENVAILSRGYKRKTRGFVLADTLSTPKKIGDEPYQYLLNLPWVKVAVCEKREVGIKKLLQMFPDLAIILLDDAFQHRAVKASGYLLLTDYNKLFTQDYLLPVGRLREPRSGAQRADAVVVTKCPEGIPETEKQVICDQIKKYTNPLNPVFFSKIVYGTPVSIGRNQPLGKRIILVTGIANAKPLEEHLQAVGYSLLHHFKEADHADYSRDKVQEILAYYTQCQDTEISLAMTQKDAVKWQTADLKPLWQNLPVFYLPITVAFAPQEPTFNETFRTLIVADGSKNNI